jgi:hypothetical protein
MSSQLALYDPPSPSPADTSRARKVRPVLCVSCRAREARYGFKVDVDDPQVDRPRTLCFECFRLELARRQEVARTVQRRLPLAPAHPLQQTLDALTRRRRRAQIAARKAMGIR